MIINSIQYEIVDEYNSINNYKLLKNNNNYYFLKQVVNNDIDYMESLNNEISFLKHNKIQNIPEIIDYKKDEYIIYKYIRGKVLNDYENISLVESLKIISKISNILNDIHLLGYIHGDINKNNIIYNNGEVYLIDFGSVIKYGEEPKFGYYDSSSPEFITKGYIDNKSDIYSIGILLYELITNKKPFKSTNLKTRKVPNIENDKINNIIQKSTNYYKDLRYDSILELKNDIDDVLNNLENTSSN